MKILLIASLITVFAQNAFAASASASANQTVLTSVEVSLSSNALSRPSRGQNLSETRLSDSGISVKSVEHFETARTIHPVNKNLIIDIIF